MKNWVELQNKNSTVLYSIVDLHALTLPYASTCSISISIVLPSIFQFQLFHCFQKIEELPDNILLMTASLLACGIDPNRSILFLQSQVRDSISICIRFIQNDIFDFNFQVPEHTQLCWVLGCLTTLSRLAQLPQFKEKSEKLKEIPLGLYLYPVLQSADILLYK